MGQVSTPTIGYARGRWR